MLTAVVAIAVRFGLWPSLFAVVAGSLCYNYFFLPPTYTLTIASPTNLAAFVFFTVVAVLVSNLASQVRKQAVTAQRRAQTTEALYAFSRKLAGVTEMDDLLWATAYQIASQLRVQGVVLLPDPDGAIAVRAGYPPEDRLEPADVAAARWTSENNRPAGRGADTLPGARRLFMQPRTARGAIGVVGLRADLRQVPPGAEGRPGARGRRLRPRDLARLRRGHGRLHRRREPGRGDPARSSPSRCLPPPPAPRGTPHDRRPDPHPRRR